MSLAAAGFIVTVIGRVGTVIILWSSRWRILQEYLRWRETPDFELRVEPGPVREPGDGVTVGGDLDEAGTQLIELEQSSDEAEVFHPYANLSHADDPETPTSLSVVVANRGEAIVTCSVTMFTDPMIRLNRERHPELSDILGIVEDVSKSIASSGEMLLSGGPKTKYEFENVTLAGDSTKAIHCFVDETVIALDSDDITQIVIDVTVTPHTSTQHNSRCSREAFPMSSGTSSIAKSAVYSCSKSRLRVSITCCREIRGCYSRERNSVTWTGLTRSGSDPPVSSSSMTGPTPIYSRSAR